MSGLFVRSHVNAGQDGSAINFTEYPNDCCSRAQWWFAPQASIAITVGASFLEECEHLLGTGHSSLRVVDMASHLASSLHISALLIG
jgi:hypothetical protein